MSDAVVDDVEYIPFRTSMMSCHYSVGIENVCFKSAPSPIRFSVLCDIFSELLRYTFDLCCAHESLSELLSAKYKFFFFILTTNQLNKISL